MTSNLFLISVTKHRKYNEFDHIFSSTKTNSYDIYLYDRNYIICNSLFNFIVHKFKSNCIRRMQLKTFMVLKFKLLIQVLSPVGFKWYTAKLRLSDACAFKTTYVHTCTQVEGNILVVFTQYIAF